MNALERVVTWINTEGEAPQTFGGLHILFTLLVIALCILLFWKLRDTSDRTYRILIGVMFGVMFFGELTKQVLANFSITDGRLIYTYSWGQFPFQLCSTPLYVLPFLSFLPDCRIRDFAAAYTMTVGLIGDIAVYLTPKTVFGTRLFFNIHTMIHHGLQIVSGVYTAIYYRHRINRRFYFDGICVFAILFVIANLLNTVGYDLLVASGLMSEGADFNMFYISPRAEQTVPVLSDLLKSFPPIVYIIGYFVFLSLGALIIMCFTRFVCVISEKQREKRNGERIEEV